jgi:hypothetical protein
MTTGRERGDAMVVSLEEIVAEARRDERERCASELEQLEKVTREQYAELKQWRENASVAFGHQTALAVAAERERCARELKERIDSKLDAHLCVMEEGYDDSVVGFNEAWDIVREIFAAAIRKGE